MFLPTPIVTVDWLYAQQAARDLKLIDASWFLDGRDARMAYDQAHIPGAVFFDIDAIADRETDLPHMLPSAEIFADAVGALGIANTDDVVVYDQQGIFSSPRAWWMFRAMGHSAIAVLDGGLPAWIKAGGTVTNNRTDITPVVFTADRHADLIATSADIRTQDAQILDARPSARFAGEAPEPRAGLHSGAMPAARNLPANALLTEDGRLQDDARLAGLFNTVRLDEGGVITTCGSGVTAAIIGLALSRLGRNDWRLYDGSWAEWGRLENDRSLFPVVRTADFNQDDA